VPDQVSLCICTTPRSGSNLLCAALKTVGYGMPAEYMHYTEKNLCQQRYSVLFDPQRSAEYFENLRPHISQNSICAVKIFFDSIRTYPDLLNTFSGGYFLHLERRDIVSQVVSLAALSATRRPLNTEATVQIDPILNKPIDYRHLRFIESYIVASNKRWSQYLKGRNTLKIYTETLISNPEFVAKSLFDLTGRNDFSVELFRDYIIAQERYSIDQTLKSEIRKEFSGLLGEMKVRNDNRSTSE
jgi:LPS sulfotransferase NodH